MHTEAGGEAALSDRKSSNREHRESAGRRPKKAAVVEPPPRKLRVEKGFTSSEDGPSTSGRDTVESARPGKNGRGTGAFKTSGPKPPRNFSAPRNPNAERSAVYEMLEGRGKAPKKSLGQNFVIDADVIRRVVAAAGVGPGDVVLEIGPGTGNLTKALAEAGAAKVISVEKDGELAAMLATAWEGSDQVLVEEADVLRWPFEERLRPFLAPGQRAKCVANLPYNITTSALKKLLPLGSLFSSCTLMLQEEAAERLVNASPGDSEYRAMSFFVNFYAEPRISFRVGKASFTPQPKCDSAVVVMGMRRPDEWPEVTSAKAFFSLVNVAFGGRRKMLRNSLQASQHDPAAISEALEELGLDVKARPEQLSLSDFLTLFRKLEAVRISKKTVVQEA
ncbi:PFC1 PALEFACE 1 [Klebsormidium nitens]|uniref:rRNA adenine N(6)-methyltransferase n=1 Tax=Klebsormidium nitens TaxID=105231 RepID=A0A1Y1HR89_KLENI|nr:PFC1 PALEFACE 1 [Klebsormidium nitens]|eukprot:GAQ81154.1 PFC1 PALEFACE 1 [Klebsormidium nitens]